MKTIEIMVEEHKNIRRMLKVVRQVIYNFMENKEEEYDLDDFDLIIDFIRSYADNHHHKKEEDILFKELEKSSPKLKNSGAILGMYIEHDNGRLYTLELESAIENYKNGDELAKLDIVANAISYTNLLDRHIEKENTALYVFAENILTDEIKDSIDKQAIAIEENATAENLQNKYISMIEELENKYL